MRKQYARKLELGEQQQYTADFIMPKPGALVFSDPGTGKTLSVFESFLRAYEAGEADQMFVFAPLSILQAAWGDDIDKYVDGFYYEIAYSKNRAQAFNSGAPVVITNHDAIKWLAQNRQVIDPNKRIWFVVDESTAYKNPTAQRTKAAMSLAPMFAHRVPMTGTPYPKSILDVWSQAFLADSGERLGNSFFRFRSQVAEPEQVGGNKNAVRWLDKPGAVDQVVQSLADITVRFRLEDCTNIPECSMWYQYVTLPPKLQRQYDELVEQSVLELENGELISAVHAGARSGKIRQLLTGSVYNSEGQSSIVHTDRAELVMQLVEERCPIAPVCVGFNWRHERDALLKEAKKRKLQVAYIDGTVTGGTRTQIVRDFQDGKYDVVLLHPQAAGHGLTFTRARTLIWSSPTENAEHLLQLNARIYRRGQEHKTEIIMIAARDTREVFIYESNLQPKVKKQADGLKIFTDITHAGMAMPSRPQVEQMEESIA